MDHCPICGAQPVRALAFDDEFRLVQFRGQPALLPEREYELLRLLHRSLPRPAYRDWLAEQMRLQPTSFRKYVWRLRARVKPIGLRIVEPPRFDDDLGGGFYLLDAAPVAHTHPRPAPAPRRRAVCEHAAAE